MTSVSRESSALRETSSRFGIGSDMEMVSDSYLRAKATPPPWDLDGSAAYLETGRQALAFIEQQLWEDGYRAILVPGFLCDSMLVPFTVNKWSIVTVKVDANLWLDLLDLEVKARQQKGAFVALTALYFGRLPDDSYRASVSKVRELGGVVIDDETHRIFAPGGTGADVAFASLRKLLPLADGAYLKGRYVSRIRSMMLSESNHGRWQAMKLKSHCDSEDVSRSIVRRSFGAANKQLTQFDKIYKPSRETAAAISHLDYEKLANARRNNASVLQAELDGVHGMTVLNPTGSVGVPSHLVVRGVDPVMVQARAAKRNIYCPIHWPESDSFIRAAPWPTLGLSIPTDHRYTRSDMVLTAQVIRLAWF